MTTEVRHYPFGEAEGFLPHPMDLHLLENEPVSRVKMPYGTANDGEAWLVNGYEEAKFVYSDSRFSREASTLVDCPRGDSGIFQTPNNILTVDGRYHVRLRKLASRAFTARRIELLREEIQAEADRLIDGIAEHGPSANIVDMLARPLTARMICSVLGVPLPQQEQFFTWTEAMLSYDACTPEEITAAYGNLCTYMAAMIEDERREPTDSVFGAMVSARDEQGSLSEIELVNFSLALLIAGTDSTSSAIGNFTFLLLTRPELRATVTSDWDTLPGAVEDMMRWLPQTTYSTSPRVATEDVQIGDVHIKAGEAMIVNPGAANRCPVAFHNPDEIDPARSPNPHLTFGHGPHHCLGAALARAEVQIALRSLFQRFPTLQLAVPQEEIVFKKGRILRGLEALPVSW